MALKLTPRQCANKHKNLIRPALPRALYLKSGEVVSVPSSGRAERSLTRDKSVSLIGVYDNAATVEMIVEDIEFALAEDGIA